MPTPPPAISVEQLTKTYGIKRAVGDLSFSVHPGEVFALLGPNGAGKSTVIEILEGYRHADSGSVRVLGLDPTRDGRRLKPQIGVMLQESGLYPAITPREALTLFARYYEKPRSPDDLLVQLGLTGAANTRFRRLSGGQKQRLALALALLPRPSLIFLDEPTAGLDPHARRETWEIVDGLRKSGTTVLLTTHYLEEAERLADRVAIIKAGKLVAVGSPGDLTGRDRSVVRLRTLYPAEPERLAGLQSALSVRAVDPRTFVLDTQDAPALLADVTRCMQMAGIPIAELRVGYGSLEDVFLELTGEALE